MMDQDGFVALSAVGNVAARARVPLEAAETAIRTLENPDVLDPSQEYEGRRIERVPYGWVVLNSKKYRDIIKSATAREQTRERVARHRAKKKHSNEDVTHSNENVTPSEAEAEAEAVNQIQGHFSNEKSTPVSDKEEKEPVPFSKIVDLYHEKLPELPRCVKLTNQRKGYIRQRWQEDLPDMEEWGKYFEIVKQSKFLLGKVKGSDNRPPFRADLAWLCKPENIVKIIEGKYHRG